MAPVVLYLYFSIIFYVLLKNYKWEKTDLELKSFSLINVTNDRWLQHIGKSMASHAPHQLDLWKCWCKWKKYEKSYWWKYPPPPKVTKNPSYKILFIIHMAYLMLGLFVLFATSIFRVLWCSVYQTLQRLEAHLCVACLLLDCWK